MPFKEALQLPLICLIHFLFHGWFLFFLLVLIHSTVSSSLLWFLQCTQFQFLCFQALFGSSLFSAVKLLSCSSILLGLLEHFIVLPWSLSGQTTSSTSFCSSPGFLVPALGTHPSPYLLILPYIFYYSRDEVGLVPFLLPEVGLCRRHSIGPSSNSSLVTRGMSVSLGLSPCRLHGPFSCVETQVGCTFAAGRIGPSQLSYFCWALGHTDWLRSSKCPRAGAQLAGGQVGS